jgi:rare lipoprotein A
LPPTSAASSHERPAAPQDRSQAPEASLQIGWATWYGDELAGHETASGERFDPSAMTAAHRTLPLGTWVEVTRLDNGAHVRVRINDRGPFGKKTRIIDLSKGAARVIGMLRSGVAKVSLRIVETPWHQPLSVRRHLVRPRSAP